MHKEKSNTKQSNKLVTLYKSSPLIFIGTCCVIVIIALICSFGIYHHHEHDMKLNHLQRIERISDRTERRIAHQRNKR